MRTNSPSPSTSASASTGASTNPRANNHPQAISPSTCSGTGTYHVFKLKFNDWAGPEIGWGQRNLLFADMIKERTDGKVDITWYFNQTLAKFPDTYRTLQSGVADGSLYVYGINPGIHNLNLMFNLPFMGWSGVEGAVEIIDTVRDMYPEFDEEFAKTGSKVLWNCTLGDYHLHNASDKLIRVPTDMKGMKIMGDNFFSSVFQSVGAAQLYGGPPDWYTNLERGLVEAHVIHWAATEEQRTYELFKSHTILGPSGAQTKVISCHINVEVWNELPAEYQKIILDVAAYIQEEAVKGIQEEEAHAMKVAEDLGQEFIYLTPAEVQKWEDLVQPIYEDWIAETEARGWPAREVFEATKKIIEERS